MSNSLLNIDIKNLKLPRWLTFGAAADSVGGAVRAKYPPVAMELGVGEITLARLVKDKEKKWTLTSYDLVNVPPGLLSNDAFRMQVKSPEQYKSLLAGALVKEGVKTNAISLVVPDHLARVALLAFEELPRTRREVFEMVRWKMKKAVPFKVEDAVMDCQVTPGSNGNGNGKGYTVLAVLSPRAAVEEHEAAFQQQGIHPGLVDLSSFSLLHLYRPVIAAEVPADGDFMLLNATPYYFTVMIHRAGRLIFYRSKSAAAEEAGPDSEYRMLRREVQASLVYYQEKLAGRQLARVYMRSVGQDLPRLASLFEGAPLTARPEAIDARRIVKVTGRIAAVGEERAAEILQRLAPAIGAALGRSGGDA